jgi:glycerophosphoryl diester phosphodiesterase
LKRITNGEGAVADLTLAQIKSFSSEDGEKIPTLQEVLDFLDKIITVVIELKETGIEDQVLAAVHERSLDRNVVLVSFLEDSLRIVREKDKTIATGLIYAKHSNPIKSALELNANYLVGLYRFVHTASIEKAHQHGLKVIVWTINTKEEAQEWAKKGVDGIATDKPDILSGFKA